MKKMPDYCGNIQSKVVFICEKSVPYCYVVRSIRYVEQRMQVRRSRRLVVSCIATVGNYEYGLFWYFQQDGAIHFEVKLTGIIAPGKEKLGSHDHYIGCIFR